MKSVALLLVAALAATAFAHLSVEGTWNPVSLSKVTYTLPQQNNALLFQNAPKQGVYEFAHPVVVDIEASLDGQWERLNNGDRVWTIKIHSLEALSLSVTFEKLYLPVGGELYIMGRDKVLGAYTSRNNPVGGYFTSFPLKTDTITVQYYQPAHVDEVAHLKIIRVAHGFQTLGFGDSGSCNINVACDNGTWSNEIRSSGMMISGFGSRFCSGAMVNTVGNLGKQYLLTAAHCSVGSGDQIVFNYESASCTPSQDGPTNMVAGNLERLFSNTLSDVTLLEVHDPIPDSWRVYLSGISLENTPATSMTGIHHPSGDIKKISFAYKDAVPDKWSNAEPDNYHWRVTSWDEATTEPGSSGSPLYDQNKRVVGQLHGGSASCFNPNGYDSYGATWASAELGMAQYIDPSNTGILLVDGTDL